MLQNGNTLAQLHNSFLPPLPKEPSCFQVQPPSFYNNKTLVITQLNEYF